MIRIYLIGYMGSGKSTVGRALAKSLNLSFIDMDDYIEERNMRTIPQLFNQEGEEGFRKIERKALGELSDFENVVIATGGGAPCFFDNMDMIKKTGTSLYLKGTPQILAERLLKSKVNRPLIKGKSKKELMAFIDETLTQREYWYKQANFVLEFDHNLSADEVLKVISL